MKFGGSRVVHLALAFANQTATSYIPSRKIVAFLRVFPLRRAGRRNIETKTGIFFFFSRNRRALVGRRKNSTSTWLALVNYQPVCMLSFLTLHSTIAISMVREHDKKLRDNSWLESSHAPTNASSSEAHTS